MKKAMSVVLTLIMVAFIATGCGKTKTQQSDSTSGGGTGAYQDGKYKASFDFIDGHGWKPFLEVEVKDKKVVKVNFDYVNPDGQLKTKDEAYNKAMKAQNGTNPAEYSPKLDASLVKAQNGEGVQAVSGATSSSNNFKALATALLAKAAKGDTSETILPMNDTYTAIEKDFDSHGWKAQVSVTYENGKITKVIYEELDKNGKKKSEDTQYNSQMKAQSGTSMVEAAKKLADSFLANNNDPNKVDTVTGATETTAKFKTLVQAAMAMRK
ncbi:MAG: FMN-binding protein [Clostridiales bacterium]|nr:FMN-binding protein [Clostridiales bacterium]